VIRPVAGKGRRAFLEMPASRDAVAGGPQAAEGFGLGFGCGEDVRDARNRASPARGAHRSGGRRLRGGGRRRDGAGSRGPGPRPARRESATSPARTTGIGPPVIEELLDIARIFLGLPGVEGRREVLRKALRSPSRPRRCRGGGGVRRRATSVRASGSEPGPAWNQTTSPGGRSDSSTPVSLVFSPPASAREAR
jgi:hypothetical protein